MTAKPAHGKTPSAHTTTPTERDTVNAITRALLEHELEDIQECHARTINQVEHLRERLRKAEEARDEYVEQVGALKETLARAGQRDNINRLRDELLGHA